MAVGDVLALMRLGVIAVDPLVELTENPKPRVRPDAIRALGKVGYDRAAIAVWLRHRRACCGR